MKAQEHEKRTQRREPDAASGREPQPDNGVPQTAPTGVETGDAAMSSEHASQSPGERAPDANVIVKTSGIREAADPSTTNAIAVPVEQTAPPGTTEAKTDSPGPSKPGEHAEGRSSKKNGGGANHDKEPQRSGDPARPLSLTRMLIYSGLVALVCGVIGAWAYAHFFLSAREGKGASGKHAGSDKSSATTASESSGSEGGKNSGESSSESGEELHGFSSSEDANTVRKEVEQLSARVDDLGRRVDSLARPRDWVSPDIRQLQVKMSELARSVRDMGDAAAHVHQLAGRLDDLHRELQDLKERIPARSEKEESSATASRHKP